MKAKNTFPLILSLALVFTLSACSDDTFSYTAFLVDHSDSAAGVDYQVEMDVAEAEKKNDSSAPKTVTLNISGCALEGTYSHSEMGPFSNYYEHIYYGRSKTHELRLDDSGQINFFIWPDLKNELKTKSEKVLTEEECLAIAKDFILNTVSAKVNLDEYTIEKIEKQKDTYHFVFTKYINGFATADEARVRVLKNGYVYSYSSTMFGRISADDVPKLDQEKVVRTIEKKLDSIYQDVKSKYDSVNYEEPEFYVAILKDGKPAIYCVVTVRFKQSSGLSHGEAVSMIIT